VEGERELLPQRQGWMRSSDGGGQGFLPIAQLPKLGHVGTPPPMSSTTLWSGLQGPLHDPHCDLPLIRGFLPFRGSRGSCEVLGVRPNLWFTVAGALGFTVSSFRTLDESFGSLLTTFCPAASALAAVPRQCNRLPDVVFSDLASLPWES
jgi:hypothetical protein